MVVTDDVEAVVVEEAVWTVTGLAAIELFEATVVGDGWTGENGDAADPVGEATGAPLDEVECSVAERRWPWWAAASL